MPKDSTTRRGRLTVSAQTIIRPVRTLPSALTIAGSDSGGGAGIQADLKTFAALGVHGASAVTTLTAQNPRAVRAVHAAPAPFVTEQIRAVFSAFPPLAIKTGMLYSAQIIEAVLEAVPRKSLLIVDPVLVATSGAVLLQRRAEAVLKTKLLPRAALATPNVPEAERLLGRRISALEDLRSAAREFYERYGCAALAKGGHLPDKSSAADFYYDGKVELLLEAPYLRGISTHGTGCTYSAAVTAFLALGRSLPEAVIEAKEFISNAIAASQKCGRFFVLNPFWNRDSPLGARSLE